METLICRNASFPPSTSTSIATTARHSGPLRVASHACGRIVDEIEGGDGFVLRDGQGQSHLLRPLMFLEPEDVELLGAAARDSEPLVLVRGAIETDDTSSGFDVSRCIFIYRLPQTPSVPVSTLCSMRYPMLLPSSSADEEALDRLTTTGIVRSRNHLT